MIIGYLILTVFLLLVVINMRVLINDPFTKRMSKGNSLIAMDNSSSKGFSNWVNKDIKKAALSGDWSELLLKAEKQTKRFKNEFYK
jgi:hypothetical protein